MTNRPIFMFKDYMRERWGEPLFRIPVDLNAGCPNRAADGSGGCTFCPEHGARAIQLGSAKGYIEQIEKGLAFARRRYGARRFMAYFQAFTTTLAPASEQKSIYTDILDRFDFAAVSIGTRPDCLPDPVLDVLTAINEHTEVWIELGIQTCHDATLRRINRGHTWADSQAALKRLRQRGLNIAAHVMLGLPGETSEHFSQTAEALAQCSLDAVKLHNLHILRTTALAEEYAQRPFPLLDHYEYGEVLMDFLRRTPANRPILRLCTDTPPEELIAPRWTVSKGQFIEYIEHQMISREWQQGDLTSKPPKKPGIPSTLDPVITDDRSITFWNPEYREHYHTPAGALLEAQAKYVEPSRLTQRLQQQDVHLLDICFGLGYNTLAACEAAQKAPVDHHLHIQALEMDRRVVHAAAEELQAPLDALLPWNAILSQLHRHPTWQQERIHLAIHWGDARFTLRHIPPHSQDLVFLDAFSTQRNSELWTVDFFREIRNRMKPNGALLTYCAAIPVRAGLLEAGFHVGETRPVGRPRGGTIATINPDLVPHPLPKRDQHLIATSHRGIPYRDPDLSCTNKEILRARQQAILAARRT